MALRTVRISKGILSNPRLNEEIKTGTKNDFNLFLHNALNRVNELQSENEEYNKLLITGELDNLHDLTIASEKANISLQLTLSIQNKLVEAYREIMRMQI